MDDFVESVSDAVVEASADHEYTAEEIETQTRDFLLSFIDQLTDMSPEQKAKLRNNVIDRALNPAKFIEDNFAPRKTAMEPTSPQDLLILIVFAVLLVGAFGKKMKSLSAESSKAIFELRSV
jgi:hypothetical protein